MKPHYAQTAIKVDEAIATLTDAGYLVVKIPPCKYEDRQHGRHGLVTRTAMCPGSAVLPHGYLGYHLGSFGGWIACKCGSEFRDYGTVDEHHWDHHAATHGLVIPRSPSDVNDQGGAS